MERVTITHVITYVTNGGRSKRRDKLKRVMYVTKEEAEAYRKELEKAAHEAEQKEHPGDEITIEVYFAHGSLQGLILR